MNNNKTPKKVQKAIKMMIWHTDLARKNKKTVEDWMNQMKISAKINLLSLIDEKIEHKEFIPTGQLTIFDFIN